MQGVFQRIRDILLQESVIKLSQVALSANALIVEDAAGIVFSACTEPLC